MNGVIGTLVEACETYIRRFDLEGAREVADGIARWKQSERNPLPANPEPSCGYLDAALAAVHGADQLRDAIIAARTEMRWITYDSYDPAEIGPRFPKAHAFVSLVGEHGHVRAQDFELGLFLIAPGTLYRDHHHAAPSSMYRSPARTSGVSNRARHGSRNPRMSRYGMNPGPSMQHW